MANSPPSPSGYSSATIRYSFSESGPSASQVRAQPTSVTLPPVEIIVSTVNLYFDHCHNQPYCFFHEETFRQQLTDNTLPEYLVLAVLAMALRFSQESFFVNDDLHTAKNYAYKAWKEVVRQSFESEEGLNHHLVQAATLLAIQDFTGRSPHFSRSKEN